MNGEPDEEVRTATEACYWQRKLPSASAEEEQQFVQWAEASPVNVRAFLTAPSLDEDLHAENLHGAPSIESLLARARNSELILSAKIHPRRTKRRRALLVGACAIVFAATALYFHESKKKVGPDDWLVYSTVGASGQSLTLEDGSQLYMMSGSKVRVRFPTESRDVQLLGGDVLFNVRHAQNRPFRVYVAGGRVQAIGTQFRVHRALDQTLVNVLEGIVQISGEDAREPPLNVSAGQSATVSFDGRIAHSNAAATSPTGSAASLVFRGSTLAEVAAAYNGRQWPVPRLVIEDSARSLTIWAIIPATEPELLISILRHQPDLQLSRREGVVFVQLRSGAGREPVTSATPP